MRALLLILLALATASADEAETSGITIARRGWTEILPLYATQPVQQKDFGQAFFGQMLDDGEVWPAREDDTIECLPGAEINGQPTYDCD